VALLKAGINYAADKGARSMLGLMNPLFLRVFRRAGINAYQFGPITDQRDGRICVLKLDFECDTKQAARSKFLRFRKKR
jgi:N-acyl-L-homoserine lactone synthetase